MLRRMLYSADRRLVEAAKGTGRMPAMRALKLTATRAGRIEISTVASYDAWYIIMYKVKQRG